jgi:hypothetical protein
LFENTESMIERIEKKNCRLREKSGENERQKKEKKRKKSKKYSSLLSHLSSLIRSHFFFSREFDHATTRVNNIVKE